MTAITITYDTAMTAQLTCHRCERTWQAAPARGKPAPTDASINREVAAHHATCPVKLEGAASLAETAPVSDPAAASGTPVPDPRQVHLDGSLTNVPEPAPVKGTA